MPLPEGGSTPWPPTEYDVPNAQVATWAAWWSGDLDQLAAAYANVRTPPNALQQTLWGTIVGYVRSVLRRWFHTPPVNADGSLRPRQRVHMTLAADIASASAGLLFSEPPAFQVPTEEGQEPNKASQARLEELADEGMRATLQEAAETCSALGGVYLRVTWDSTVAEKPWLTAIHPDSAIPEWTSGKLTAVTLWRVIKAQGQRVVRHLERHEKGVILHGVYEGSATELGNVVPLTEYPETAGLAEGLVNGNEIPTGTDQLTCRYVPNLLPNRIWRHLPVATNLGVADIAGLESLLDFLDMTYSSWARAVEQGQPKLVVPASYLTKLDPGEGATFDMAREMFQPVASLDSGESGLQVEQVQFEIPVDQFKATIDQLKTDITSSAGYSGRSFGLDQGVKQATATEVNSLDRKESITRDRKICYWSPALQDILEALTGVDAAKFGGTPVRPDIQWPDGVSIDPLVQAQTLAALDTAGAISTEQKVKELHPDWDQTRVDKEVKAIESASQVEDPSTFRGGPFGESEDTGEPEDGE